MYREYKSMTVFFKPADHEADAVRVFFVEAPIYYGLQRFVDLKTENNAVNGW